MPRGVSRRGAVLGAIAVAVVIIAGFAIGGFWRARHMQVTGARVGGKTEVLVTPVTFAPPPHSIAVLPFANISGDASQDYFSEGLTEELLNSLSRINELQVAARTSSFSFQGAHPDIATVAHRLNVASVLEGSVRRSGHTVRITAQLDNAVTGFHIWSETYDRDLGDVLQLQTEIATAVAGALRVKLLGDVAERIELGGTRSPAAFDMYLRALKAFSSIDDVSSLQSAITEYTEAIRLDPGYALAFAGRSRALSGYASEFATGPAIREFFDKAQADAREALKLAPELAEGQLALATYLARGALDFKHADEAYERAVVLAPGNAAVLADSGRFAVTMGRFDAGLTAGRRAVALDPLGPRSRYVLGQALHLARRDQEAVTAFEEVISLEPDYKPAYGLRGLAYYGLGDFKSARSSCETTPDYWASEWCLAVTNDKLGQHADAEAALKKLQAAYGDAGPVEYASIYAQWGNTAKALEWLTTAMRLHNPDLLYVKTDPLLDPLRKEPRFQAIQLALNFPN
jgi:TolB-like protein